MEEKMLILKMLQDGKISADEAAKLLDSVATNPQATTQQASNEKSTAYNSPDHRPTPMPIPVESVRIEPSPEFREPTPQMAARVEPAAAPRPEPRLDPRLKQEQREVRDAKRQAQAQDFSRKVETVVKDWEPKLQKFTEVVVERTASFADKISKTLSTPPTPDERPKPAPAAPTRKGVGTEVQYELTVIPSEMNELNFTATNGFVFVKGYNGDKISAKITYIPKVAGAEVKLMRLGSNYYLSYEQEHFESVNIEAYMPSNMFRKIHLETDNADASLEGVSATDVVVYNQKGKVTLKNIKADTIKGETSSAPLTLNGIFANRAIFEDYNGSIDVTAVDVADLKVESANAPIVFLVPGFNNYSEYFWKIQTSNEKLKINLPSSMDVGYYIKAYTSLNEVAVGMSSLNYIQNSKNSIEAKTGNYDVAYKKVKLEMDTSNALLSINM